ncbi:MAG: hypothetical protein CMJ18_23895 [Phycisphaeraceae bacterium]|nr:hypothetical protein [Phycisphaeraceae bacterium]
MNPPQGIGAGEPRISPDARIEGATLITGSRTSIGPGAVVHHSRIHDAVIETGAQVIDSIVQAEEPCRAHRCDAAGRTIVQGADLPCIGPEAQISGSTLINSSVGGKSRVRDCWMSNCRLGTSNDIADAKLVLTESAEAVSVTGPTEVSEAWLGHHATIDRRGYFEGVFSNTFFQLKFDEAARRLRVTGAIDLPHLSRYGTNTVNSANSGKLLPQPDSVIEGFGPHVGLWHDGMLSHEQIELGPCCWIVPWTKVIGQSAAPHEDDEALVNDGLTTFVMPFGIGGYGGPSTQGLVMPGELSTGIGPKARHGAWTFTYAPDAIISMVARLYDALEEDRRHLADTIVIEALRTAFEMTRAMAAERNVDLDVATADQRKGWPRWIARAAALLTAHLEGELWQFREGRPVDWTKRSDRWTHPRIDRVLDVAGDALDRQLSERDLFSFEDPVPPKRVAMPTGSVRGTDGSPQIDPSATVAPDAEIGPGCRIGATAVVESGARLWNSIVESGTVRAGAVVERSIIRQSEIGAGSVVRSTTLVESALGAQSTADAALLARSRLPKHSTVSAFADVADVDAACATIVGGTMHASKIDVYLMSMHMAGGCAHLSAITTIVRVDGRDVDVPAIPMLGGGSVIRGTADRPVTMQSAFIGSNAIIEPNTYVGFGCFVLGTLGPDAGLPPFTVSTGGGPQTHLVGQALGQFASVVITHFVNWLFQAVGPEGGPAVAALMRDVIEEGAEALEFEQRRRERDKPDNGERFARYRSLPDYSDAQIASGLAVYRRALESGAWDIRFDGAQLRFAAEKGKWVERNGSAFWKTMT